MNSRPLDFLIIGAQKSGTTSLHHWLAGTPGLRLPEAKEVQFFTDETRFSRGWEAFFNEEFYGTTPEELLGKVTPHYMTDARVAGRVAALMPDVRLVACLRNPIERAISHYKMEVRRGGERRTLDEAIAAQCDAANRAAAREPGRPESDCYVAWGEYARQLQPYADLFPREHVRVIMLEGLEQHPDETFAGLLAFLGVDPSLRPANVGQKYFVGQAQTLLDWLRGNKVILPLARLLPRSVRAGAVASLERLTASTSAEPPLALSEPVRQQLIDAYRDDVSHLERLLGGPVPWPEFRGVPQPVAGIAGPRQGTKAA